MSQVPEDQRCKCRDAKSELNDDEGDQKVAAQELKH